jgi:hypothetical protein
MVSPLFKRISYLVLALVFVLAFAAPSLAAQYARPTGTVSSGNWTANATTLHGDTGEVSPNDANYMSSSSNNDTCELNLSSITDPGVTTGFAIRFRAQMLDIGNVKNPAETITVELWDGGGAAVATTGAVRMSGFALYEATGLTVAGGTNFAALTFRVSTGGIKVGGEQLDVSWLEFEAPDPPGPSTPTLSAPTATAIDTGSALLGATIDNDNGDSVTDYGTVWNTTGAPITENAQSAGTNPGSIPPALPFSHNRTISAAPGTQIFYRGYWSRCRLRP